MKLSGAEILIKTLQEVGVDTVFGYPGGAVLPVYDALYSAEIRHILTRHEQGAGHAADGYARVTGKPGVCLVTSGPGATNLVTAIANAYMDSIPMVAVTGQVSMDLIGRDSFQEADITGITLPITKHNYLVEDVRDLSDVVKEAFHVAGTGRPGPVLIDLPKDVSTGLAEYTPSVRKGPQNYHVPVHGNPEQVQAAAEAILASARPVIYAGGGVILSGAEQELLALAQEMQIPVATTLMGLGGFPEDNSLSLGMLGMHGTRYANYAISDCDLLIALGVRFDDRVTGNVSTFAPYATIIHVDIDPAEIGKNKAVDIPIVGDLKAVLSDLLIELDKLRRGKEIPAERSAWVGQVNEWKAAYPLSYDRESGLKPQYIIEQIYEITRGEAIIATDVGQHQMWAAQFYRYTKPRTFVSSGGLGTMGFGLPAAIGAQVGCPDAIVFDIAGDGSIQMTSQELATAVHYQLPIKVAIINNRYLGMVRQWQELFYGKRYSHSDLTYGPDFVKLAEAYGAAGIRVTDVRDVPAALSKAMDIKGPVVIDFIVDREENVFPMVPPGGSLNKMMGR